MGGGAKLCGRSQTDGWAGGEAKAKPRDGNDGGATGSLTQLPSAAADGRWTERCPAPSSAARSPPTIMPRTSPGSRNRTSVLRSEEHMSETPVTNAQLVCRLLLENNNSDLQP